jgi:hypothetical protein
MIAVIGQYSIAFANTVVEGFRGQIRENAKLGAIPDDLDQWRNGDEMPQGVRGESQSEPGYYRLFKYEREIRESGFRTTGKNFGGLFDVYP